MAPLLLAGVIGQLAFEASALALMPAVLGMPLMPAFLVVALGESLLGIEAPVLAGWLGHLAAGIVVFRFGYLVLQTRTGLSWLPAGAAWGVALWLVAQGLLAPLAGRPVMLGLTAYTWASLGAHLVYALAVAFAFSRFRRT